MLCCNIPSDLIIKYAIMCLHCVVLLCVVPLLSFRLVRRGRLCRPSLAESTHLRDCTRAEAATTGGHSPHTTEEGSEQETASHQAGRTTTTCHLLTSATAAQQPTVPDLCVRGSASRAPITALFPASSEQRATRERLHPRVGALRWCTCGSGWRVIYDRHHPSEHRACGC
jgi:hypothetical protein